MGLQALDVAVERIHQRHQLHGDALQRQGLQGAGRACAHRVAQAQQRPQAPVQAEQDEHRRQCQDQQLLPHGAQPQGVGQLPVLLHRLRHLDQHGRIAGRADHRLVQSHHPHRQAAHAAVEEMGCAPGGHVGGARQVGIARQQLPAAGGNAVKNAVGLGGLEQLQRRGQYLVVEGAVFKLHLLANAARRAQQQAILHHRGGLHGVAVAGHRVQGNGAGQRDQHPGQQLAAHATQHVRLPAARSPGRAG